VKSLQPDKEHLRQLEARVESLEAENKALRAALDLREMASRNSLGDASSEEVAQNITAVGQAAKLDDQIDPVSNTLTPAAKIQLFRTRFTGRADLYARRWESRSGDKKGYAPVCSNEWRDGICKNAEGSLP